MLLDPAGQTRTVEPDVRQQFIPRGMFLETVRDAQVEHDRRVRLALPGRPLQDCGEPKPPARQFSSTVTTRRCRLPDTASRSFSSSGLMNRMSTTSAWKPSRQQLAAACRALATIDPTASRQTSSPSQRISAVPMGNGVGAPAMGTPKPDPRG